PYRRTISKLSNMIWPRAKVTILFTICVLFVLTRFITAAPTIVVKDIEGKSHTFFSEGKSTAKPLAFIFVLPDCPVCNSYVAELKRLSRAFPQIDFFRVYADPDITAAEARQHSKDYDFGFPGLLDPEQQLVRISGAKRTPEVAIFSPEGKLIYRGRIDDRYVDFGKKRDAPQQRDLQNALDAILHN